MSEITTDESEPEEDDSAPSIDEDERADIDLGDIDPDEIEENSGRSDGDDQASSETEGDQDDGAGAGPPTATQATTEDEEELALGGAESFGDIYVGTLAVFLEAAVDEYGDSDLSADDVVSLARGPPVNIGANIDRMLAESDRDISLSPGLAVIIGTATVCGTVLLTETDLLNDAVGDLVGDLSGGNDDETPELD